ELPLHEHDSNLSYVHKDVNYIESDCGDRWQYVWRSSVWYRCYSDSIPCYVNPQNIGDNASYAIYFPHVYEMGIGLVYEKDKWQSPSGANTFSTNLIYYEKDGNGCGEQWFLLSTDNREVLGKLKLWPNPAQDAIQVSLPHQAGQMERLEIYNSAGILVEQFNHQQQGVISIDIGNFPSGLYLVKAIVDKGLYTQKLVVK
ncbi:MAG: T9SS type A sorting domain-containing protein, partial [Flavobacteriales bacterium]|nr:T9SS type A sorting domain-containing protein [Flavobacteriales bacterium]